MPRRPFTPAHRKALSRRMKACWAKARAVADVTAKTNGVVHVATQFVFAINGHEFSLGVGEARQLREALTAALVPTEPTHE